MLFQSFEYLVLLLPAVVLLYYLLPFRHRWLLLLVASYVFYMYWRPEYGLLLLASTGIDYIAAIQMDKHKTKKKRKRWLWISIITNIGFLSAFKYLGFLGDLTGDLFRFAQFGVGEPEFDILLPIGISFYTFQTLSYTIDVYRRKRPPERHFGYFALYVSFFPQLVAGPIERSTRLLPQFHQKISFSLQNILDGGRLVLWGLFKKVLIADTLAYNVNLIYGNPEDFNGLILLVGTFAFGFQLYLDFSAYTDIAIGSARMLGIDLMSNFERPFRAKTIREFWSRWHISLTSWMFDYLYKPLSKRFKLNWQINILITFLVIGIWHGAGWNFVFFGLVAGLSYILSYYTLDVWVLGFRKSRFTRFLIGRMANLLTFVLMVAAAVFFRVNEVSDGFFILGKLITDFQLSLGAFTIRSIDVVMMLSAFSLFMIVQNLPGYDSKKPLQAIRPWWLRWAVYYYIIFWLIMFGQREPDQFLYFQF